MSPWLALLLLADLPVRTVTLSAAVPTKPVRVACPVGQTTRIVFPEALLPGGVRVSKGATDLLGIALEASHPVGIVTVRPETHPSRGTLTLQGPSMLLTVALWTSQAGVGSEIRIVVPRPAGSAVPEGSGTARHEGERIPRSEATASTSRPGGTVAPSLLSASSKSDSRAASVSGDAAVVLRLPSRKISVEAPATSFGPKGGTTAATALLPIDRDTGHDLTVGQPALDLHGFLLAHAEHIGRREGLPGQRTLMLEDALTSEKWVWLRFVMAGGSHSRIDEVSWENGLLTSYYTEAAKSDLRIVVQLPRERVTKRTRVSLKLSPGGSYRFALSAPWLTSFVRGLFQ